MKKKLVKIIFSIIFFVFVTLISLPLVVQTRPFKNWLAHYIENAANKNLKSTLSIGRIDGNFFTNLEITDVALTFEQDTIAQFPSLAFKYDPRSLLNKNINISSIVFDSPDISLYQFPDSSWVFEHLVKQRANEKVKKETKENPDSSGFSWTITLGQFELINLGAKIVAFDSLYPQVIKDLNISLDGLFAADHKLLTLHNLSFQTFDPDFTLSSLTFQVEQNREGLTLEAFQVVTGKNKITADANTRSTTPMGAKAEIATNPIDFSEFHFILPTINIAGRPEINVAGQLEQNRLEATLRINSTQSEIDLNAVVSNFNFFTDDSIQSEPGYDISGSLSNIMLSDWLNIERRFACMVISRSEAAASRRGRQRQTSIFSLPNAVDHRKIQDLSLVSSYNKGSLEAQLNFSSDMGSARAIAHVEEILSKQNFSLTLNGRNLDLAAVLLDSSLLSDINFDLEERVSFSIEEMAEQGT